MACVSIGGFAAVAFVRFTRDLPTVDQLVAYQPPAVTRVLAADGALIGELYTERRYPVPLDRVPLHVRRAFLAAEDAHFYEHAGVDVRGVARAAMVNLQRKGVAQGGSTITQQLVKMLLLSPERSWQRKAKEMYLAIRLELATTKDDILRLYLNQVYLGRGAYGVQAAAQRFFGVDVQDLSTAQAALLAGLVQAPGRYNPERRPDQARARQAWVLERMLLEDFITPDEYAAAVQEPLVLAPRHPAAAPSEAPWYLDHVRRILDRYYGNAAAELGLTVHTAVDLGMQRMAEESLRGGLRDVGHRQPFRGALRRADDAEIAAWAAGKAPACRPDGRCEAVVEKVRQSGLTLRTVAGPGTLGSAALVWHGEPLPTWRFRRGDVVLVRPLDDGALALDDEPGVEGALVAFEPSSGQVKALVGGYAYERSQFNRATQARRQPGSAFKPLLYAAALDHGFTPASRILDAPVTFGKGRAAWSPQNFGGKYYGRTNLRDALTKSLNTVSVRLLDKVGVTPVIDYLGRFGLHDDLEPNLSLALGTAEVTLLDLVRAYGVFASGGQRVEPLFITKVENLAGDDVPFPGTQGEMRYPAIDPAVAYVMTSMLESVVTRGTARRALELGRPAAGKTGTTNDSKDAWFVGYTPELLTGVWVGFDAGTPLGEKETGGRAATPIWTTFMQQALADRPIADFTIPEGVTFVDIEPWSGLRAVAGSSSRREVFVTGTEPTGFARRPEPEPTPEPEAPLYVDAIHPTAAVP